jgi:uncharacterized protein (TIGR02391 family)
MSIGHQAALKQLQALQISAIGVGSLPATIAVDFNILVDDLTEVFGSKSARFKVPTEAFYDRRDGIYRFCDREVFAGKVRQATAFLEASLPAPVDAFVVRAGTLFSSLRDSDLKARCEDLLSAPANFDRAINQATQVLEDRIRRKSGSGTDLTGVELVNRMIKSDPAVSLLVISQDAREQEGFANICRGLMMAFRNQTHHELTDRYSREDALKVCAFIDLLLFNLQNSTVR